MICKTSELVNNMRKVLLQALELICHTEGVEFTSDLASDIPKRWEKHGDLVLLPASCFKHATWSTVDQEKLWNVVAKVLKAHRVAKQDIVTSDDFRSPRITMLKGDDTKVVHVDNRIRYHFDISKCMFSSGNISEKIRMSKLNCKDEVIVDMFAGIGYFTLPLLVHARAAHVHACEWNPDAIEALKVNLEANKVVERCSVHEGDNREVRPVGIADRVVLGLIPSARSSYTAACEALNAEIGGILHIHENVTSNIELDTPRNTEKTDHCDITCNKALKFEWLTWAIRTASDITNILQSMCKDSVGKKWSVKVVHVERVKSYAPHVDHLVLDLHCKPIL